MLLNILNEMSHFTLLGTFLIVKVKHSFHLSLRQKNIFFLYITGKFLGVDASELDEDAQYKREFLSSSSLHVCPLFFPAPLTMK
jgi:hypothetical protein